MHTEERDQEESVMVRALHFKQSYWSFLRFHAQDCQFSYVASPSVPKAWDSSRCCQKKKDSRSVPSKALLVSLAVIMS